MPTVSVTLKDSEKVVEISGSDTILNELEDQGVELPRGCLAGSCGTCKVEVTKGAENIKEASAVEKDTLKTIYETYSNADGKIIRLSCRARALGDISIKPFTKDN